MSRAEAVQRGRFVAFYQALTAVGLWPAPVAEAHWWVQWSYPMAARMDARPREPGGPRQAPVVSPMTPA